MKVKIKRLNDKAIIPKYAKPGDAGMDLTATSKIYDEFGNLEYGTGLAVEIPEGYVGLLFPRSSNCKKDLLLSNSVGVIDSGYRGEILVKFKPSVLFYNDAEESAEGERGESFDYIDFPDKESEFTYSEYEIGDRIAQLIIIPYPQIEFEEADDLSETERLTGGFGSTN